VGPIVPALEAIWSECRDESIAAFNFRSVTDKFNKLVYRYPIRIPERYALVIRSLLTQVGRGGASLRVEITVETLIALKLLWIS
jgi:predicted unusual protein kinase regulating ubiquinone biosynthesis (AarF/ABC1/UbiB family)